MIRSFARLAPLLTFLSVLLTAAPAGARDWHAFPPLTSIEIETSESTRSTFIRARTAPDSSGQALRVAFLEKTGTWERPALVPVNEPGRRLDQVLVFAGGLFDQFAGQPTIDLGSGFTLARRDTGYALLENGEDRGWPAVTEDEVDRWGGEVRLGLPREFPEDRLHQLLAMGRLKNVPGPAVVTENGVWFGLAGGFSGGDGQFGGLVVFDRRDRTFHVLRHKYMVDAAVTRLLIVGDDVWMGTGRFGPVSIDGLRGVVLFRPNKREWRQFAPDNSRISGDLVFDLATDGRMLWATTNQGVSRYDRMRRLWTSWYWHPAKDGKGFELTDVLPTDVAEEFIK